MTFNVVADRIIRGRAYPALAQLEAEPYTAEWQRFVQVWPYTVPCELLDHMDTFGVDYTLHTVDNFPAGSYYLIGIGWFDLTIDYFDLMTAKVITALQNRELTAVFYYHEGDNPARIKQRLNQLAEQHGLPFTSFKLVSGNTQANNLRGCVYFPDHELLYWRRNSTAPALPFHSNSRNKDFTLLSRTHKWWRATIVADLKRNHLLDNSHWSYNTEIKIDQTDKDNSIRVDELNLRYSVEQFLKQGPYRCDTLTAEEHNDHSHTVAEHYQDSLCNIVLETHFNPDGSDGAFLTEKTFKPIKHAQPFVIAGAAGSLQCLRDLGYRVFDSVIDNTYDTIYDDTERWRQLFRQIVLIKQQDPEEFILKCQADLIHNQQLFLASKQDRLNNLLERLK